MNGQPTPTDVENAEETYMQDMFKSLEILEKDPHFKRVILEGYFKNFAVDQTSMLASDYVRQRGARPEIMERLVAISQLQDYFITIKQLGAPVDNYEDETEDEV